MCAYLFSEYKYIVIPSTNKKSTELYECVLLDPKDRSHIYIQVKKGNVSIDANEFRHLQGKVFLFTSGGTVNNLDSNNKNENIEQISPEKLFDFAMSDAAKILFLIVSAIGLNICGRSSHENLTPHRLRPLRSLHDESIVGGRTGFT